MQSNLARESDCVIQMSTTLGWLVHITIAVTKEPALVQLLRVVTSLDVMEKCSEYMLVEKLMDK